MTVHAFFVSHCRVKRALSAFLTFLLLLPTLTVFARPLPQTVSQARPAVSPPSAPASHPQSLSELKVGDIIHARSNATGRVEWKQVVHASRRTVPSLLSIHLLNIKMHQQAEPLVCPLDEPVRLTDGRTIPAGHLAVGKSIVPRAGPACKVTAMFLLRKPGGFLLCDVRVGPLSAAQRQRLASAQQEPVQPRPHLSARFAGYHIPILPLLTPVMRRQPVPAARSTRSCSRASSLMRPATTTTSAPATTTRQWAASSAKTRSMERMQTLPPCTATSMQAMIPLIALIPVVVKTLNRFPLARRGRLLLMA